MLDPADPVTIGAMVGPEAFTEVKYLMHAKQMQALDAIPEIAAEFEDAVRPPVGRAGARLPRRGRRDDRASRSARCSGTIEDVVDELREQGVKIGALGDQVLPPLSARGGPRGARAAPAGRRHREGVRRRRRRHRRPERPPGALRLDARGLRRRRRARRAADHQALAARPVRRRARRTGSSPAAALPRPRSARSSSASSSACRATPSPGPHAENILRDLGIVAAGSH